MAENEEDLSMEEILSSIKNILMEDNANQKSQPAGVSAEPVVGEAPTTKTPAAEEKKQDDVMELTSPVAEEAAVQPLSEERPAAASEVSAVALEEPIAETIAAPLDVQPEEEIYDLSRSMMVEEEAVPSETIDLEAELATVRPAEENPTATEETVAEEVAVAEGADEAPAVLSEEFSSEQEMSDAIASNPFFEQNIPAEPVFEEENENNAPMVDLDNLQQMISDSKDIDSDPVFEVEAQPLPQLPDIDDEASETETASPVTENETVRQDAVEASANILSNFAKLFSKEQEAPQETAAAVEEVAAEGPVASLPANEELENMVREVIAREVGNWVKNSLPDNAGIEQIAADVVNRRTEDWLNQNLPTIVERIVKEEMAKIMNKVNA